jgi:GH25 family lysozyme M1 (1,4-beta-N-acetylmuramidase)
MTDILDVSEFNGFVDFKAVRKAGIVAVYIRACVGLGTPDKLLDRHALLARDAGLPFGVYGVCYARHGTKQDASAQALELAEAHRRVGATLRPMVDVEDVGTGATGEEWLAATKAYAGTLDVAGLPPIIYTGLEFWESHLDLVGATGLPYPLWLAAYLDGMRAPPKPWDRVSLWQYQGGGPELPDRFRGKCPGVAGDVDRSRLLIPLEQLRAA